MMPRALRVCASLCLYLMVAAGCERAPPVQTLQLLALGTVVDISAAGGAGDLSGQAPQLRAVLAGWDRDMYAYGDGELAAANAAFARGECVKVSVRLRDAIADAQRLERRHAGLFSAGQADLTRLWQLHRPPTPAWRPPTQASIAALTSGAPRALNLSLRDDQACPTGPVALDVGGFAKGRIVDELLDALAAGGLRDAIVNVGGDLKVRGRAGNRRWRIAIRDPRGGALGRVALSDGETAFTSGNYERFRDFGGTRYGHILDPHSGAALSTIASVTVFGLDATTTDAAATALYVAASRARAGDPQLSALQPVNDAEHYVIIDTDGVVFVSETMRERLELIGEPARVIYRPSAPRSP